MRILPIPFIAPMVRGLLREIEQPGTGKTQTRRVLEMPPMTFDAVFNDDGVWHIGDAETGHHYAKLPVRYRVGDRLYVREAWRVSKRWDETKPSALPIRAMTVMFEAGGSVGGIAPYDKTKPRLLSEYAPDLNWPQTMPDWAGKPRPAMFMPRWASRITLTITEVRVQRLQEISEQDSLAEGIQHPWNATFPFGLEVYENGYALGYTAVQAYRALWNHINSGRSGWDCNPWVVAYTFVPKLINIDAWSE
ncbi:hypothetical protein MAUB1S_11397 [Mycolicibacterium aubagnense]